MKKLIKSKLFLQVIVASMVATLATVGIVAATTSTIGANILTDGTLGAGATTLSGALAMGTNGITTTGNIAFATASSTGAMKVASLGIASSTPAAGFQLSIGSGAAASSTVSMGKFCLYAGQENGTMVYIRLGSNQAANQPFATSTIPCNQ